MKRQVLTALILTGAVAAQAADFQYLTIEKKDGTAVSLTAVGLDITYADGSMTATNGSETATLALTDVSRMFFSNSKETTAIAAIDDLLPEVPADVYSLSGRLVASGVTPADLRLPAGIYIVKQQKTNKKIQVR